MLSYWDNSVYCSPLADVLCLDAAPPGGPGRLTHWTNVVDPSQDALALLAESASARAARDFVAILSPRDRAVVRLMFWEGQRQSEIARTLGVSRMAVTKIVKKVFGLAASIFPCFRTSA